MQGALALPRPVPWRRLGLAALVGLAFAANLAFLVGYAIWVIQRGGHPFDFPIYVQAADRFFDGTLYQWNQHGYIYPYSPVFALAFMPFAAAGMWVWWALHFVAVALIPSWPWRLAILLSAGFWMDTYEGNVTAFFMLAGYWMVRGNRWTGWAFLVGTLLVPKPQFIIIAAWLMWRHREYVRPLPLILPVYALLVLATGYAFEWPGALLGASHDLSNPFQFLPSRIIGAWWLLAGIPLAVWLAWKDHPGWASIVGSLYAGVPQLLLLTTEPLWQGRQGKRTVPNP